MTGLRAVREKLAARRDRLSRGPGASRHAQFRRCAGRGDPRRSGPRLIVNNEEERFSGNKHTTEYPQASIDAMVATLRGMGRDVGDIDAWLTSWDYPVLAGDLLRSVLEEAPQSFKLLRNADAPAFDSRRLDQMTRTPKDSRQAARPFRARAADLHAASRQPCLVFLRGLAVRRRRRTRRHRGARRHRRSSGRSRSMSPRTARCASFIAMTACSTRSASSTA